VIVQSKAHRRRNGPDLRSTLTVGKGRVGMTRAGHIVVVGVAACVVAAATACGSAKPTVVTTTRRTAPPATFADVVQRVRSGIVRIETTTCDNAFVGTGFLLSPRLVATVEHVVDGAQTITLKENGKVVAHGSVIGSDIARDLALIRTDRAVAGYHLHLASRAPRLAETVEAIGFPLALPLSATRGSVSGLDRSVEIDGINRRNMVQTDAAVNPGNSGGPLLTINGQVVGLVDLLRTDANGTAYAVSAQVAGPLLTAWQAAPQPVSSAACSPSPPPSSQATGSSSAQTFTGSDFSILYPSGFVVTAAEVNKGTYYDTTIENGGYLIRIDENPGGATGKIDADSAAVINGLRREAGYQQVSLGHTIFQGHDALRWEFEVPENGVLLHKIDLFFVGDTGSEWGVLTQAPADQWSAAEAAFAAIDNTFRETR